MSAILTDTFKRDIFINIEEDINNPNSENVYYLAYSRSIPWDINDTVPTPKNNIKDINDFKHNALMLVKITDASLVIPRSNWNVNSTYSTYSDKNHDYFYRANADSTSSPISPDYVITPDYQVYVCLKQGKTLNANQTALVSELSTNEPEGIDPITPFKGTDGYIWKYLYTVGPLRANKFMGAGWMPVDRFTHNEDIDIATRQDVINQLAVQDAAVPGQIIGYEVVQGGNNYSSNTVATVSGDGTGAEVDLIVSSEGVILDAKVKENSGVFSFGQDYTVADIELSNVGQGSDALIRPIFAYRLGLGYDPRIDLRSTAIMLKCEVDGDSDPDLMVGNDFRQIGIIKNPVWDQSLETPPPTANPLRYFTISSIDQKFTPDSLIQGANSGAKAYVARHDDVTSTELYFFQNDDTGYDNFAETEIVNEVAGAGSATIDTINEAEIDIKSSEILFIDNRDAISRSSEQKEDVKIIIKL